MTALSSLRVEHLNVRTLKPRTLKSVPPDQSPVGRGTRVRGLGVGRWPHLNARRSDEAAVSKRSDAE
ncbi:hypothetical protein Ssi02_62660 [Sinosporangium siamense]|uniref:Uncharacterized protein n=1 Tax=Sinosporangium siamense TaxID=1367973 RepID=A0A919RNC9_9ACTN|nr:hypothetical protein Ssi02_62660 [Sinosporangium siamense]